MSDIVEILEEQTARTHVFAALDTLEYLRPQRAHEPARWPDWATCLQHQAVLKMHNGNPTVRRASAHEQWRHCSG